MKKYFVCAFLFVFMMLVFQPQDEVAAAYAESGTLDEGLSWEYKDGTLTITGNGYMRSFEQEQLPPWYSIRSKIKRVIVSEGVQSIGSEAFMDHTNIEKVQLPSTILCINNEAFRDCTSLVEINIPNKVKFIEERAFHNCQSLKSIVLPDSVTELGQDIFWQCFSLESVTLSNGLDDITAGAFQYCRSLTSITVPKYVRSIGFHAFYECENLKTVNITGRIIRSVGYNAFAGCSSLESLQFSSTLAGIGNKAFTGCSSLKEIRFEGDMPEMGDMVFSGAGSTGTKCNLYYPVNNKTWTQEKMDKELDVYANNVQFVPYGTTECNHEVVVVSGQAATCTEAGKTEKQYCSKCEKVLKAQSVIDALGHDFEITIIAPTCEEPGYDLHKCKRCQLEERHNEVPALEHDFSDWETVKEPTEETSGVQMRSCNLCQTEEERSLEPLPPSSTEPLSTEPSSMEPSTESGSNQSEPSIFRKYWPVGVVIPVLLVAVATGFFLVKRKSSK